MKVQCALKLLANVFTGASKYQEGAMQEQSEHSRGKKGTDQEGKSKRANTFRHRDIEYPAINVFPSQRSTPYSADTIEISRYSNLISQYLHKEYYDVRIFILNSLASASLSSTLHGYERVLTIVSMLNSAHLTRNKYQSNRYSGNFTRIIPIPVRPRAPATTDTVMMSALKWSTLRP